MPLSNWKCLTYQKCNLTLYTTNTCQCPNFCIGAARGNCTANQCVCNSGWTGADCSLMRCPENTCSGRGVCTIDPTMPGAFSHYCQCQPGFVSGPTACIGIEGKLQPLPYGQFFPGQQYTHRDKFGDEHPVFNKSRVAAIHIEVDDAKFRQLIDTRTIKSVGWIPANFTFDNGVVRERLLHIGMDIKGQGSAAKIQKGFKFNFGKFIKGQQFYDMDSMSVKTGVHVDETFMRMTLPTEIQRALALPAQRNCFAVLYVNSQFYGTMMLQEEIDKLFLKSRYEDFHGNLYKCTADARLNYYGDNPEIYKNLTTKYDNYFVQQVYSQVSGADSSFKDLVDLIKVFNMTVGPDFEMQLDKIFDLDILARGAAISQTCGDWDNLFHGNNFMLYNNPGTGKWEAIYQGWEHLWDSEGNLVENVYDVGVISNSQWKKLFELKSFRSKLTNYMRLLVDKVLYTDAFEDRINYMKAVLLPFLSIDRMYATVSKNANGPSSFTSAVSHMISSIKLRNEYTLKQLDKGDDPLLYLAKKL